MVGASLRRFIQNPTRLARQLASDPVEAWTKFQDRYAESRERRKPAHVYRPEPEWERRLHETAGMARPCEEAGSFETLWDGVMESLRAKGVKPGPNSFGAWNDGDKGLTRAIWCLVLHLRPRNVVETGVGHGVTSRFILEALARSGAGKLSSVDVPPMEPVLQKQVGMAVENRHAERWTYIKGSSRRRLPALLAGLSEIDMFIHDSLHSERNVRFELDREWKVLRPGGAGVVDDVDANAGFHSFLEAHPGHVSMVCEAEPLHPDLRRFNKKGLFGIILKKPVVH